MLEVGAVGRSCRSELSVTKSHRGKAPMVAVARRWTISVGLAGVAEAAWQSRAI